MKNGIMVCLFLSVFQYVYAQSTVDNAINECIRVLGNDVPEGYQRMDRTKYQKDIDIGAIVLLVENGKVVISGITAAFNTTREATFWNSQFYNILEQSGVFYNNLMSRDIYIKSNVYISINNPYRRDDGNITAVVLFSKNISNLFK